MESNEAAAQLSEVAKLRSTTAKEASKSPAAAWPVMAIAMILFFSSNIAMKSDRGRIATALVWALFVGLWVAWVARGRRARPGRAPRSRAEVRRDVTEWIALFVVCNLVVQLLSRVSWALVGVAIAIIATGWGALTARRAQRR
jgi:hypothetical protein